MAPYLPGLPVEAVVAGDEADQGRVLLVRGAVCDGRHRPHSAGPRQDGARQTRLPPERLGSGTAVRGERLAREAPLVRQAGWCTVPMAS